MGVKSTTKKEKSNQQPESSEEIIQKRKGEIKKYKPQEREGLRRLGYDERMIKKTFEGGGG